MKKGLVLAGIGLMAIGVLGYLVFGKALLKPGKAALQVASTPDSKIFLNGEDTGEITPYFNDKLEVGEYDIKLVPQNSEQGASDWPSWGAKVNLVANIITSITHQFGSSEELSSGEIVSLEKVDNSQVSSLAVVAHPSDALIRVNDDSKGFAPILEEDLSADEYQVTVSAPGFTERTVSVQTIAGYKLTVSVKLAQEELEGVIEATESGGEEEAEEESEEKEADSTPVDLEKPYVKILSTPTGWLRVRMGPSREATEAAKVNPGEAFSYLDEEEDGWYKIEYEKGEEGWVSGVYADLVE